MRLHNHSHTRVRRGRAWQPGHCSAQRRTGRKTAARTEDAAFFAAGCAGQFLTCRQQSHHLRTEGAWANKCEDTTEPKPGVCLRGRDHLAAVRGRGAAVSGAERGIVQGYRPIISSPLPPRRRVWEGSSRESEKVLQGTDRLAAVCGRAAGVGHSGVVCTPPPPKSPP